MRIQQSAGGEYTAYIIVAVRQLKSGDLVVYINSSAGKREIEKQKSWVELICPSAVVRKRTWPVIVHGVKMENYQLDA
jgi:hypothetical protein